MRLLRTRFRRRKNVGAGNQHVFAWRNLRNQIERGLVVKPAPEELVENLPSETNRQFAERMRAEKPVEPKTDGRRFASVTVKS